MNITAWRSPRREWRREGETADRHDAGIHGGADRQRRDACECAYRLFYNDGRKAVGGGKEAVGGGTPPTAPLPPPTVVVMDANSPRCAADRNLQTTDLQ